jgi:hypothetical protein
MRNYCVAAILALSLFALAAGCSFLAGTGTVFVESSPAGAGVYLNDSYKGVTPLMLNDVPPGTYLLELRLEDYANRTEVFTVRPGSKNDFSFGLRSLSAVNGPPMPPISSGSEVSTGINATVPLSITVLGDGTYSSKDVIRMTGNGPKGTVVAITITEASGISYSSPDAATIRNDGTWDDLFDLKTIPIAAGECTVTASVAGGKPESASVKILIRT